MQGTLCELFEIPELMTACARNEAFDEVLDLYALVEKGVLLHPDSRVMLGDDDDAAGKSKVRNAATLEGGDD